MTTSNFPYGFNGGLTVRGQTILNSYSGNIYWVNSGNTLAAASAPGTLNQPFNTIDNAMSVCVAGDIIMVAAGHAETISAAGGLTCDVVGVAIIGVGEGANRPTLTFSATGSSVLITAASVTIENIVGTPSIDSVTNPFHVQAADVGLFIEWRDASSAVEAVRAILTTTAANNLTVDLTYKGFIAGNAVVNAIQCVGVDNGNINVNFYGVASTAVVNFVTTACTNMTISGYMYNSGTTDATKDVVDTITGSTWYANIEDGAAGGTYEGGSATSGTLSPAEPSAADFNVPTANSTANATVNQVVGNKTDASVYVPGTTNSLSAYAKGTANLQEKVALKAAATMTNGQTLFTIAGGPIQIIGLTSICATDNNGTASTLQYSVTPTSGSATTISGASASLASAVAGASVTLAGTALSTAALYSATGPNLIANPGTIMAPAGVITAVVGVGSTTGTWTHYLRYKPLAVGVTVS